MIPSDHFPRFYNEVFKFIEQQGEKELEDYFLEISKNQENHLLHLIEEKGFAGMLQYWSVIRDEENCDLDLGYDEDKFEIHMHQCPSLPKAQDPEQLTVEQAVELLSKRAGRSKGKKAAGNGKGKAPHKTGRAKAPAKDRPS